MEALARITTIQNIQMKRFDKSSVSHNQIKKFLGFVIIALFLLLSCGNDEPLSIAIRNLSACTGPDENGKPQGVAQSFSSDENIFACGRFETNQPITLSVSWYHEGKYLGRETLRLSTGYFYSQLREVTNQIETGDYEISIVIGRDTVYSTHFQIEASE